MRGERGDRACQVLSALPGFVLSGYDGAVLLHQPQPSPPQGFFFFYFFLNASVSHTCLLLSPCHEARDWGTIRPLRSFEGDGLFICRITSPFIPLPIPHPMSPSPAQRRERKKKMKTPSRWRVREDLRGVRAVSTRQ